MCKDWYGLELKVGDKVIPMCSEACICYAKGEIKNIHYLGGDYWIDIYDKERNYTWEKWNAFYFSTQERFNELQ
jgi:hypothetical protein